ncbi:MAG: hypothetical protein EZS28_007664 [Streblomastix strix]|uniref:Uncharacterized protein n=1 Tax=Streblomastix strix TaxID=222440 RepID=A0A5J4WQK2_9EUKA|nr:MAG: hypothetical protein EZS28_007664 [Streblomastix strix]
MTKLHFMEGDADSAYWTVSGSAYAGYQQQFNYVIKDKQFYDDNAKYLFYMIENDLLDEKKILGLAIENERVEMITLAQKNYYIKVDEKERQNQRKANGTSNGTTNEAINGYINETEEQQCWI